MYNPRDTIIYKLLNMRNRIKSVSRDVLAAQNLNYEDFNTLLFIYTTPGMTQAELAEVNHKDRNVMGHVVDRLEQNGFVERKKNPADRRTYLLYVTEKGELAAQKNWPYIGMGEDAALAGLTAEEKAEFYRLLQKAHNAMVK